MNTWIIHLIKQSKETFNFWLQGRPKNNACSSFKESAHTFNYGIVPCLDETESVNMADSKHLIPIFQEDAWLLLSQI